MTTLILVRHGQASFAARNYDKLSPLGERQGAIIGRHWAKLGFKADAAYCGKMERQRETGRLAFEAQGVAQDIATNGAFDEYNHQELIRSYAPLIAREHPEFALHTRDLLGDRQKFQGFFEKVIAAWLTGRSADTPITETWEQFRERCVAGLRAVTPRDVDTAVVFTSGGVITIALQEALKLDSAAAFQANWGIYNGSVHRFHVGKRGLSLLGFNNVTHFELENDPSLLTFR